MSYHEAVPYKAYAVAVPKFLALAHAAPVPASQLEHPRSADLLICTLLSVNFKLQKPDSLQCTAAVKSLHPNICIAVHCSIPPASPAALVS